MSCSKGQSFCFARKKWPIFSPCRCSALWAKIYAAEFSKDGKTKQKNAHDKQLLLSNGSAVGQDQPLGFWKMVYFRSVAARDSNKWKKHLRTISNYTGLPSQTERVLRYEQGLWPINIHSYSSLEHYKYYIHFMIRRASFHGS